jgi:hypothetical protein
MRAATSVARRASSHFMCFRPIAPGLTIFEPRAEGTSMELSLFPVKYIDVRRADRAKRDALLRQIDARMSHYVPPGERDENGVTHAEHQRLLLRAQRALAAMAIRQTPKPPSGEALDFHVGLMHWLRERGFAQPLESALPMPSPETLFALADAWQRLLLRMLPVDDDEESAVSDVADLIDQFRDWAARDFSMGIYVG